MEKIGAKESRKNKKKKMTASDVVLIVIFVVAITVAAVSGYKLYSIMMEYKAGVDEYNEIADTVVKERDADAEDVKKLKDAKGHETKHWTSPLEINFDELKSINQDVAGWLYMEALPNINYPIVQGSDNDFYLHHTYKKESIFAGSIFVDCKNTKDFSDQNTIVYGHNMKNGSMFGTLKQYAVKNGDYTGTVIVPPEQFKTMIDIVDASDDDANIDITIDSGKLYMDYSKKHVCIPVLDKKYPAVQRMIDGEIGKNACKFSITIAKRDFIESISCVQYVLQETGASGVNSSAMLKFKEKELEIGGIGLSQYGEKIEAETVGEVPEPAYFNPDFLKEAASIYPKDKITIGVIGPKAPIWMCCGDSNEYVYCVLPRKRE